MFQILIFCLLFNQKILQRSGFVFEFLISETYIPVRLIALSTDGASVNGVQRGGKAVGQPFPGSTGNLAWALQQVKNEETMNEASQGLGRESEREKDVLSSYRLPFFFRTRIGPGRFGGEVLTIRQVSLAHMPKLSCSYFHTRRNCCFAYGVQATALTSFARSWKMWMESKRR